MRQVCDCDIVYILKQQQAGHTSLCNIATHISGQSNKRNDLYLSNLWWQHQSFVISVHHNYNTDRPCRYPPRVLISKADLPCFRLLKWDVEHLRKVLAQMMRRCCLKRMYNRLTSIKKQINVQGWWQWITTVTCVTALNQCILYLKRCFQMSCTTSFEGPDFSEHWSNFGILYLIKASWHIRSMPHYSIMVIRVVHGTMENFEVY